MDNIFPKTGQGLAVIADAEALDKDKVGFTHPNLHRRIDPQPPEEGSGEVRCRDYKLGVYGTNSYRTTVINTHDEESTTSETP